MRRQAGFTLIELMVAGALLTIVSVFLLRTLTVNHQAYVVVDQVGESQQNMRAVSTLIEHDVRHAGLMVPEQVSVCGVDNDDQPDILYVSDADAIDPATDKANYSGLSVGGGVDDVSGSPTLNLDGIVVEGVAARAAYDLDGDGDNDSDFQPGAGVIIYDSLNAARGSACGRVTAVNVGAESITITVVSGSLGPVGALAQLVAVPAHEYRVVGTSLFRDGLRLADGVEDLQVAYFFDADGDGAVDAGEYWGVAGNDYVASARDASQLREVRVDLVVRTRAQDPNFTGGQFQATENRAAVAGNDGFRRRVYQSTMMLRNVGTRIAGL